VLGRIRTHCLLIALRDDVLFPVDEVFSPEAALPHVACHVLECDHGHDSILTHQMDIAAQVSRVLAPLAVLRRLRTLLHEIPA
jgi:homoserine acetyltransferase